MARRYLAVVYKQVMASYTVKRGDTLFSIARRFGTTVDAISRQNRIANPNRINVGQVLQLPSGAGLPPPAPAPPRPAPAPAASRYTVQRGDTLFSIARRFGTTVDAISRLNRITNPNRINVGQALQIPGRPAPTPPRPAPPPPRPTPPPATQLPRALFGSQATDPIRLALVPLFHRWADAYRVPRDLLKAIAFVESSWRADALSPSGAIGIGQLLPATAAWVNQSLLGGTRLDPRRPEDNIRLSARLLRYLLDETGNEPDAVASYLQGLGSVRRDGRRPQTQVYVWNVGAARNHFR
jgi:N-acetylmuramoyl-L-alanine amidase